CWGASSYCGERKSDRWKSGSGSRSATPFPTRRSSARQVAIDHRPYIMVLGEQLNVIGVPGTPDDKAEPVPGPSSDVLAGVARRQDRKSTRLNSSHVESSYAVFCLKKKEFPTLLDDLIL